MGWGFRLPSFPRPPFVPAPPAAPPFISKVGVGIITAPMKVMEKATATIATIAPQGGMLGKAAAITAATAAQMNVKATESVSAAMAGDLNKAARAGLQAVAEPSKASNRATLEVYSKLPAGVRTILSTVVGTIFPVSQLVFMALDLQMAANARNIAKLREREAKATQAEIEQIRAEIAALEADNARMQADKNAEKAARGIQDVKPSFKESITFAWFNAFNRSKEGN